MKFKIYCVLAAILFCFEVSADSLDDEGHECLKEYLKQKGKIESDVSVPQSSVICRFAVATALGFTQEAVEIKIKNHVPDSAECLIKEFNNNQTLDLVMKIQFIRKSKLSESQIKVQLDESASELREDLRNIALQCDTDGNTFIEAFNDFLGIKNVTLSALQHNYCLATYAAKKKLLPLENVELNPKGIETTNVNCDAIIQEEHERVEKDIRLQLGDKPNVVNCIMEEFKNKNFYDDEIRLLVLNYLEFPKEIKEAEAVKTREYLSATYWAGFRCGSAYRSR